jgi:hypothetical protein
VKDYTTEFQKMDIMPIISPKKPNVLLKYLGGLHNHFLKKVMLLNPRIFDEIYVQETYLENIGNKKENKVVPNKMSTNMLPRKERRSGNGKIRIL